jgi:hypothetical protein
MTRASAQAHRKHRQKKSVSQRERFYNRFAYDAIEYKGAPVPWCCSPIAWVNGFPVRVKQRGKWEEI